MMRAPREISAIIVMGVSGSGKSTIAAALAQALGFACEDGDSYHPQANIEKMSAGVPLTDDDRWPWLQAIADDIDRTAEAGEHVVISCSALRRAYRDVLVHARNDVMFVYLRGSHALIAGRVALRRDHFMPASLLESQIAALEEPASDEPAITVDIDTTVNDIVNDVIRRLNLAGRVPAP